MEWVLVGVALAAAVAAGAGLVRARRSPSGAAPGPRQPSSPSARAVEGPWLGPVATIRLDVAPEDPDTPAVRRLVDAAAGRVLRSSPDVTEVVVEDRTGVVLARVPRQATPPGPPPTRPDRAAPPARPHGSWREPTVPHLDEDVAVPTRTWADRLDLPDAVRAEVREPDDPAEMVRAILRAAGREAERHGGSVRSGDVLVILVEGTGRDAAAALSQAFLRVRESGATTGIVVHLGYVDPREVTRRRALAPDVHHVGPEVLQAMADAVALGGDPIAFALAAA